MSGWIAPRSGTAASVFFAAELPQRDVRALDAKQKRREAIADRIVEIRSRHDEAPRADALDRIRLAGIGAGRRGETAQEPVLGHDARGLLGVRHDEARAARVAGDGDEARPAQAAAPQRRSTAIEHHLRPLSEPLGEDRLEILLGVEAEPVHDVSALHREAGAARVPRDRPVAQIDDRTEAAVGVHGEHAGSRIHHQDHLESRRRPADAGEQLVRHLAEDKTDVDFALLEQRHVLQGPARRLARDARPKPVDFSPSTRAVP